MSWKILLSGYVPDYLYEIGGLDTTKPFAELEKLSHVNQRAHAAEKNPAFSRLSEKGYPNRHRCHDPATITLEMSYGLRK